MKRVFPILILLLLALPVFGQQQFIQFIYTSDSHYGTERDFRGRTNVDASEVNRAMIEEINGLPALTLPEDGGARGGEKIDWVDYVINTGDIANRAEKGVQRSVRSWRQFRRDWNGLSLSNADGVPAMLYLLPGNHDISNAVGHPSIPPRKTDATAAAEIYNAMLRPAERVTKRTYRRDMHLCNYSFDDSGIRFVFLDMWPDTRNRAWLDARLQDLPEEGVCLLFAHDQPDVEAKHLINPNGSNDIGYGFENLTADISSVADPRLVPVKEHIELDEFLSAYPVIKGYFHGNDNYNEFYTWGETARIPVFRVDSPMKGSASFFDGREDMLSFQFVVIDTRQKTITVREYFWNRPADSAWGQTVTVNLLTEM